MRDDLDIFKSPFASQELRDGLSAKTYVGVKIECFDETVPVLRYGPSL